MTLILTRTSYMRLVKPTSRSKSFLLSRLTACVCLAFATQGTAQQKGQYVPGQFGLNAGTIPDPGLTYQNLALNYSASQLNDSKGNPVPALTGTYAFWV